MGMTRSKTRGSLDRVRVADDKVYGAGTPRVKRSEDPVIKGRKSQLLIPDGLRMFRLGTTRLSHPGQHRAHPGSNPNAWHKIRGSTTWVHFAMSQRYLANAPRVDADFACDVVTRPSGLGMLFGRHRIQTHFLQARVHFYACVKDSAPTD